MGEVGLRVKGDSLVARIVAHHVAFATVDAHVLVDHRHRLLRVVQVIVGPDTWKGLAYHLLHRKYHPVCNIHLSKLECIVYVHSKLSVHSSVNYSNVVYISVNYSILVDNTRIDLQYRTPCEVLTLTVGIGLVGLKGGRWTSGVCSSRGLVLFL